MRTLTTIFSALALTLALGCSGGDGDGDGGGGGGEETVDAAAGGEEADAMPGGGGGGQDGTACVASEENPTGGCAQGYGCLQAQGQQTGHCRQLCPELAPANEQGQSTIEDVLSVACQGYSGPGASFCLIGVQDGAGQVVANACQIFCVEASGMLCDSETCDGTCPGEFTCQDSGQGYSVCQ